MPVSQQHGDEFARGERKRFVVRDLEPTWALGEAAVYEQFGTPWLILMAAPRDGPC